MIDEVALIARVQRAASPEASAAARAYSTWGEHAAGWIALGLAGAVIDRGRRRSWLAVSAAAVGGHAAAIVIKRGVRRPRPSDPRIEIRVATPSNLSFPSAHAASTTAAAVALSPIFGRGPSLVLAGAMAAARVTVGVHYPSDVAAGAALGVVAGSAARRVIGKESA